MRLLIKLLLFGAFAFFVYATFARLAYGTGAPIPWKMGGYYPPPTVRNTCLETYRVDKSFRCDRIYGWSN